MATAAETIYFCRLSVRVLLNPVIKASLDIVPHASRKRDLDRTNV